jgi:hypothetical protein
MYVQTEDSGGSGRDKTNILVVRNLYSVTKMGFLIMGPSLPHMLSKHPIKDNILLLSGALDVA